MTIHIRAFDFKPSSINEKDRTVELIASTGAGVQRMDMDGPLIEVLSLKRGAVDLSRIEGMPLLDSHLRGSLDNILGVVTGARLENEALIVRVRISERAEGYWTDIRAGIIRNVSIGYSVEEFEDSTDPATGERVRTVSKWTLLETSLVPIGADGGAKIRSYDMPTPALSPAPSLSPAPAPPQVATRAAQNAEIRALGETFAIETGVVNDLIDRGATIDEARAAVIQQMQTARTPPAPRITMGHSSDNPETFRTLASEALYARHSSHKPSDAARQYIGMTTLDIARECLRLRSLGTTGLSPALIIERALHSTSDFPALLTGTGDRALMAAYQAAPAVLKTVARKTTAQDFRAKTKLQLGEAPALEKVTEGGEFRYGTMAENKETYRLGTFGKIIGLSRQAITNDDLGAFVQLATAFGLSAAEFEAQFLVDLLESNSGDGPAMNDTYNLFDATNHLNKAASGAAPGESTLSAARLAMRKQTGLSGRPINTAPKFLLVPPELETSCEKLLAAIQATKSDDVNPFGGKLQLLVEARLSSAFRWYLAGDPAAIEGLEYAYLQGQEGPYSETRQGFEVDGVETKCRLDFGAAFIDHRSWYMNQGD